MPGTGGSSASGGTTSQPGTGGRSASGGTTSQPGSGGAAGGNSGRDGGSATGGAGGGTAIDGGGGSAAVPSAGCGKTPTLKNSPTATANQNTISGSRQFLIRWPSNYDNTHPYRLILDFHGAGGSDTEEAPSYFGLFDLSNNTTIFVAPSASGGIWDATADLTLVDAILKAVEADLCIDTSRVELEGFSQGGAMVATLACSRPGVFRAAVGHSRGGLTAPTTCQPIPYLGSLGLSDVAGNSQATQTDPFAKWNGCTVTTMPLAPTGGHVCQNYTGCPAADPVIWCSFDGPHTASPTDSGKSTSWMPAEVWPFLSQY
jgi:poly(3-hydroxybutyrate) depolymerase